MSGASGVTTTYENRTHTLQGAWKPNIEVVLVKIGIGIFAHNEEKHIGATLASLGLQDLLRPAAGRGGTVEVRVIANGCGDGTVPQARSACRRLSEGVPGVNAEVVEVEKAGKSNAWNEYVHRFAPPDADYLVFMDADIQCVGCSTLRDIVEALKHSPEACAGVGRIFKDIAFQDQKSPLQSLSLATSELARAGAPKIAGSLYVLTGAAARLIWLPSGLLVEDGFLRAMVLTLGFSSPENVARIVRAEGAMHTFEAERALGAIFRHEKRLTLGTAQNILLFGYLRGRLASGGASSAGELIRELNGKSPEWVAELTRGEAKTRGWRMLPLEMVWLPFKQLGKVRAGGRYRLALVGLLRAAFNAVVLFAAYRDLQKGRFQW